MKQEPVAIVNINCENNIQWFESNPKQHNGYFLYTAPKELSDEEIDDIYKSIKGNFWESAYKEFAKAILKKASEK